MALKLTKEELTSMGFTLEKLTEHSLREVLAKKPVGRNFAFFLYEEKRHTYSGPLTRDFEIVVESDRGYITVVDNIETLERFHELENVLNKK